jgi:hypothetical protein
MRRQRHVWHDESPTRSLSELTQHLSRYGIVSKQECKLSTSACPGADGRFAIAPEKATYKLTVRFRPGMMRVPRGVAQPGSAPDLGSGGRTFESCRPDQECKRVGVTANPFVFPHIECACLRARRCAPHDYSSVISGCQRIDPATLLAFCRCNDALLEVISASLHALGNWPPRDECKPDDCDTCIGNGRFFSLFSAFCP